MNLSHIRTKRLAALLAIATLTTALAACHSLRNVATDQEPAPAPTPTDEHPAAVVSTPEKPRELTVLNFSAVVEGASVNGQLRMASDSLIWLSVTKILELGRAMATPDSVWVSVPLASKYFAGNYTDLQRYTKRPVSFDDLQRIAASDNAEAQIEQLARQMGFDAKVRITRRQKVQRLTFPFTKQ